MKYELVISNKVYNKLKKFGTKTETGIINKQYILDHYDHVTFLNIGEAVQSLKFPDNKLDIHMYKIL